jgi:hypothetical protein
MKELDLETYLQNLLNLPDDKLALEVENIKMALKKYMNENDLEAEERKTLSIVLNELEEVSK